MPNYDPNNVFAKILRGEIPCHKVYEDDGAFAFLDIMPRAPGPTLVVPLLPVHPAKGGGPAEPAGALQGGAGGAVRSGPKTVGGAQEHVSARRALLAYCRIFSGEPLSASPKNVLPLRPPDDIHQFGDLAALLALVARGDGVLHAVRHVVAQDLLLDTAQRGAYGGNLRDDVDAVAVGLHHARKPPHLALDAAQPSETGRLDLQFHGLYIPLPGNCVNKTGEDCNDPA